VKKIKIEFEFQELLQLSEILKKRLFKLYDIFVENNVNVQDLDKNIDFVIKKFEDMKPQKIIDVFKIDEILGYLYEFKQLKEFLKKIEITITGGHK